MRRLGSKTSAGFVWIIAVFLLLSAGVGYRSLASHLKLAVGTPVRLPVPLAALPMHIQTWVGKDVPIPQDIQRVAGNDDFINRLYTDELNNDWVNLYIAYTARPRSMLGHRPENCYVGGGWVHDSSEKSEFFTISGRRVECLIQRFHRPGIRREEIVVLNFYILNGQFICSEDGFSGVSWRTPNISGNPARYVTQVQISSVLENSVREAASDMTELIMDFFPDQNGEVKAKEYISTTSDIF